MMKAVARGLLAGAVMVAAIAVSNASAEEARLKGSGIAYGSYVGELCAKSCNRKGECQVWAWFSAGSKWYPAFFTPTCTQPSCPHICKPGRTDH
jgi:hypothetical protein